MAFSQIAYITRLMRSSMLETMRQDYIRTERSKGVPEFQVIGKYEMCIRDRGGSRMETAGGIRRTAVI